MTEQEWLVCIDPTPMLELLRRKASDRKLRLFAMACWVNSVHFQGTQRERETLLALQQFADGRRSWEEVTRLAGKPVWAAMAERPWDAALLCSGQWFRPASLLRELFSIPFGPIPDVGRWQSSVAVSVATGICADDGFAYRLPILADALEDAGCTNAASCSTAVSLESTFGAAGLSISCSPRSRS